VLRTAISSRYMLSIRSDISSWVGLRKMSRARNRGGGMDGPEANLSCLRSFCSDWYVVGLRRAPRRTRLW
jgi:hypothetical protein